MEEGLSALQKLIDTAIEFAVNYSFQVLGAILILVLGIWIANWVAKLLMGVFEKQKLDITLSKFLTGMVKVLILAFVVLTALGNFGITIAPFIAALGAAAFGVTYAIQGPLSNYGAGVGIILGRPFGVGDTITVAGVSGVVQDVKLACTVLTNEDGIRITIPNKHIVGEVLHNSRAHKVVEGVVGISYDSDPGAAVEAVREALAKFPEIAREPLPQIGIQEFADSSIHIGFRYWVPTIKWFQTLYAVNLAVFQALQGRGIKIPFPQRDLHLVSAPQASSPLTASQGR